MSEKEDPKAQKSEPETGKDAENDAAGEDQKGQPTNALELLGSDNVPYVGTFVSATILLTSLLTKQRYKHHKYYEYGIAVATVAMFFSLVGLALSKLESVDGKLLTFNNSFLFLWSFIGACFMTFGGPFKTTGNGYFSSWGIAIFAVMSLGATKEHMQGVGPLTGLFVASTILIIAAGTDWSEHYSGELIYGIIVAGISILVCGLLIKMQESTEKMANFFILAFLAINWIVSACVLTFRGPFLVTGNGYFGAWGGVVTSIFATKAAFFLGK